MPSFRQTDAHTIIIVQRNHALFSLSLALALVPSTLLRNKSAAISMFASWWIPHYFFAKRYFRFNETTTTTNSFGNTEQTHWINRHNNNNNNKNSEFIVFINLLQRVNEFMCNESDLTALVLYLFVRFTHFGFCCYFFAAYCVRCNYFAIYLLWLFFFSLLTIDLCTANIIEC